MHKLEFDSDGVQAGVPILLWAEDLNGYGLNQAFAAARHPATFKHVAIMPDGHAGKGVPIGTVLAFKGAVCPSAVGVDIGCGMRLIKLPLNIADLKHAVWDGRDPLKEVADNIKLMVPMGVGGVHRRQKSWDYVIEHTDWDVEEFPADSLFNLDKLQQLACKQLGTLGSGNHFIEIQKDDDGNIYVMLHTGSRRVGYDVAAHYITKAREMNRQWHSRLPPLPLKDDGSTDPGDEINFFPLFSEPGMAYVNDMNLSLKFAKGNRNAIMESVYAAFANVFGPGIAEEPDWTDVHHNFAALENHMGSNVMIHRKGATSAYEGQPVIIPGDMGSCSYFGVGKGNVQSFKSCSHGAGRTMGRMAAKRTLSLEGEQAALDAAGVQFILTPKNLDESGGAYKDIGTVMAAQEDLVGDLIKLTPIIPIKGA